MRVRRVENIENQQGRVLPLRPGQTVRARVLARLREGYFRIAAGGQLFAAESDLPLEAGQRLIARVEVSGSRILLRIQDDDFGNGSPPGEEETQDEIQKVLTALELNPAPEEVLEFRERLERYRSHASLPDLDPRDLMVLAILWSRGIRGGAAEF